MASRIQGITVEIGGDTTKLDPGNAELMAQKQRLLSQAVSETKEKLDALKLAG